MYLIYFGYWFIKISRKPFCIVDKVKILKFMKSFENPDNHYNKTLFYLYNIHILILSYINIILKFCNNFIFNEDMMLDKIVYVIFYMP